MELGRSKMDIIQIRRDDEQVKFNKSQANQVIPVLLTITRKAKNQVNNYKAQAEHLKHDADKVQELETDIHQTIKKWGDKVSRLGGTPVGIWKVIIPSLEQDPYEWEFPQAEV